MTGKKKWHCLWLSKSFPAVRICDQIRDYQTVLFIYLYKGQSRWAVSQYVTGSLGCSKASSAMLPWLQWSQRRHRYINIHIYYKKKKKRAQFMFLILAKSGKHVASHYVSARVWHIWATLFHSCTFFCSLKSHSHEHINTQILTHCI